MCVYLYFENLGYKFQWVLYNMRQPVIAGTRTVNIPYKLCMAKSSLKVDIQEIGYTQINSEMKALTSFSPLCKRLVRGKTCCKCGFRRAGLFSIGWRRSSSRRTARTSGCGGGILDTRHEHVVSSRTRDFIVYQFCERKVILDPAPK